MLSSPVETENFKKNISLSIYIYISQTLLLPLCHRHVTIQMKGSRCQAALQIEDRLHIAEQTSVSLNSEACQASQVLG